MRRSASSRADCRELADRFVAAIRRVVASVGTLVGVRSFALALLVAGCASSHATADVTRASAPASVRYLALGDSFTVGTGSAPSQSFPARLVERWGCHAEL